MYCFLVITKQQLHSWQYNNEYEFYYVKLHFRSFRVTDENYFDSIDMQLLYFGWFLKTIDFLKLNL